MLRAIDPAVPSVVLAVADARVLPSPCTRGSAHRMMYISGLNLRAWLYPCRGYTRDIAIASVRLRASVSG